MKPGSGKIFFVGAGPGDPGLITVRGLSLIERADVVVLDALVDPSLARRSNAEIIYVGKRGPGAPCGRCRVFSQKEINRLLVRLAQRGKRVVRLKGGDPFLFGRASEEVEAARAAHLPYEIVPGVSSITAAPAFAGIPITDRRWSSQLTIVTGHKGVEGTSHSPPIDWERLSPHGTLVILMGVHRWQEISLKLLVGGFAARTPVAAVESGTLGTQRVIRTDLNQSLREFRRKKLASPAVIVVGNVARLADTLNWVKSEKPLLGKRIVVTRASDQSNSLRDALEDLGAHVIVSPSIETRLRSDAAEIVALRETLLREKIPFDGVIFFSVNGVRYFAEAMGSTASALRRIPVIAVGPKTAEAALARGWRLTRVAREFNAAGVRRALGNIRDRRFLIPRVQEGPDAAIRTLIKGGALVSEVACYETRPLPMTPWARQEICSGIDMVTFTSASTAQSFFSAFTPMERRSLFSRIRIFSIGPSTTTTLKSLGMKKIIQSKQATIESLVEAIFRDE